MRKVFDTRSVAGVTPIEDVQIDEESLDDVPLCLSALQQLHTDVEIRERLLPLLEQIHKSQTPTDPERPWIEGWRILVLAVLRQTINCDYDYLTSLANELKVLRQMLGHAERDETCYDPQTILNNESLLKIEVMAEINDLIVEVGHKAARE